MPERERMRKRDWKRRFQSDMAALRYKWPDLPESHRGALIEAAIRLDLKLPQNLKISYEELANISGALLNRVR